MASIAMLFTAKRLLFSRFDDFAVAIETAMRTSTMWQSLLMAVRTLRNRRRADRVVGSSLVAPSLGMTAFRIRHGWYPLGLLGSLVLHPLLQLDEHIEGWICGWSATIARFYIQDLAALETEPFAVGPTQRLHRQ